MWHLEQAKAVSEQHRKQALARQAVLTKPAGSLGQLETLAVSLAALQYRDAPRINDINIHIFAADHGIAAENVSAFPQAVTAQMVQNFSAGGAAISVLAKTLEASLAISNVGTVEALAPLPHVNDQRIGAGTANFAKQAAMTEAQCLEALAIGQAAVNECNDANDLFIGGEMGIANTSSATALACALLQQPAVSLVGPGTGIDKSTQQHKASVIDKALALHKAGDNNAFVNLQRLGGFEIAALTGAYISAAQKGIPVLVDGFICTVAARYAMAINPSVKPWLLLSHCSAEPGHQLIIDAFEHAPLIDLQLRLGEGSGAAITLPLLKLACELHNGMASFADAGVSNKT